MTHSNVEPKRLRVLGSMCAVAAFFIGVFMWVQSQIQALSPPYHAVYDMSFWLFGVVVIGLILTSVYMFSLATKYDKENK